MKNRGSINLVEGVNNKNQNKSLVEESYVYDSTNRMIKGVDSYGEGSI